METMKQCTLVRTPSVMISWIPAHLAVLGKTINLKEEDGTWTKGWIVSHVGGELPTKEVVRQRQDYKNMREMTDI